MKIARPTASGSAEASGLSVSQVTRIVKQNLEGSAALQGLWVRGETSNVRLAGSGHLYFTLKDEAAQLRIVYFGYGRGSRKAPGEGLEMLVHGGVRVYERGGEYQLLADDIVPVGQGGLAARFEELKRRLHDEGLFDESRKVPAPSAPRCIGLVTGLATAALQDVLNVLRRRAPYLRVILFPASVQGDGAPAELIAALKLADAHPDTELVMLVRGGGSIEDLWCFNDEKLARELARIEKPVITGVGHEIDFTIADFVADRRAPTPSAAAELATLDAQDLAYSVDSRLQALSQSLQRRLREEGQALDRLFDRRLLRDAAGWVDAERAALDALGAQLLEHATSRTHGTGGAGESWYSGALSSLAAPLARRLDKASHVLPLLRDDLLRRGRIGLQERLRELSAQQRRLEASDPARPLEAGFALVWQQGDDGRRLVRDPAQVAGGEKLTVQVRGGEFDVRAQEPPEDRALER